MATRYNIVVNGKFFCGEHPTKTYPENNPDVVLGGLGRSGGVPMSVYLYSDKKEDADSVGTVEMAGIITGIFNRARYGLSEQVDRIEIISEGS